MNNYSKNEIVLIKYPFSDLINLKIRPAVVINDKYPSYDLIVIPLTSKINNLLPGEFVLKEYIKSGLNVETAVKRGFYTIDKRLVVQSVGHLNETDKLLLIQSIKDWLNI
jgi:mRNA interferase MazF